MWNVPFLGSVTQINNPRPQLRNRARTYPEKRPVQPHIRALVSGRPRSC